MTTRPKVVLSILPLTLRVNAKVPPLRAHVSFDSDRKNPPAKSR